MRVPLLAYSVPVQRKEGVMRVDWATIDKVIEWVRSRIYELCMPTERTVVMFKYTIDDPIRSFRP